MKISDELYNLINDMIDQNYIVSRKHDDPSIDYSIYNYSVRAQYDKVWNEATMTCRGLILDSEQSIIARPFKKFFNLGEGPLDIINNDYDIYEKLDGSLGILYFINNIPYIATRGSFNSEQAIKGTQILRKKYSNIKFDKDKTYLFEIIYPDNRIVVDYDFQDLILLAIVNKKDGTEEDIEKFEGIPKIKKYKMKESIWSLGKLNWKNHEGFVVRFKSGNRVKIKFDDYLRLHRLMTRTSLKDVWEILKEGKSLNYILDNVPDEFYEWVKKASESIRSQYNEIENICKLDFKVLKDRKETAEYYKTRKYPSVLFSMLDNKDYSKIIWKLVKPKREDVFKEEE